MKVVKLSLLQIRNFNKIQQLYLSRDHVLEKPGERFVEPGVRPPVQSDRITEPLVGQFVSDDHLGFPFVQNRRVVFVIKQVRFSNGRSNWLLHIKK